MTRLPLHLAGLFAAGWICTVSAAAVCPEDKVDQLHAAWIAAQPADRPTIEFEAARCHYEAGRWNHFFGMALHGRSVDTGTLPGEKLRLLELLGTLRHCRLDRAKMLFEDFRVAQPVHVRPELHRIELVLGALPAKPTQLSAKKNASHLERGIGAPKASWPVSQNPANVRGKDPFRLQLIVGSECTAPPIAEDKP